MGVCMFNTLNREDIRKIKRKYPSIFQKMQDNFDQYEDEDMTQRVQFCENIPYFRKLDPKSTRKIVKLIKFKTYELGDLILGQQQSCDFINILWEGSIQVRVSRVDPETGRTIDLWMDTIDKGACFSVYTAFCEERTSLVDFYANSSKCVVYQIDSKDLIDLAKDNIDVKDRLNTVKLRIKNNLVDDIDYFTFPKKYLEYNLQDMTDRDIKKDRKAYIKSKRVMIDQILRYASLVSRNKAHMPPVIGLLSQIRQDLINKAIDKKNLDYLL